MLMFGEDSVRRVEKVHRGRGRREHDVARWRFGVLDSDALRAWWECLPKLRESNQEDRLELEIE